MRTKFAALTLAKRKKKYLDGKETFDHSFESGEKHKKKISHH